MKACFFALLVYFLFIGSVFGMDFGDTTSELETLIEQSRLMQSNGKNDMESNLDAFQVMMLKQFFLKVVKFSSVISSIFSALFIFYIY